MCAGMAQHREIVNTNATSPAIWISIIHVATPMFDGLLGFQFHVGCMEILNIGIQRFAAVTTSK